MILIVGGAYQGKGQFARELSAKSGAPVTEGLHEIIRSYMEEGFDQDKIMALFDEVIAASPDMIFTADEIGYGIVPVDRSETLWREQTGRIVSRIAQKADKVYRVMAGIPQQIK